MPIILLRIFTLLLAATPGLAVAELVCQDEFQAGEISASINSALLQKKVQQRSSVQLAPQHGPSPLSKRNGARLQSQPNNVATRLQSRTNESPTLLSQAPELSANTTLGIDLPAWLQDKMILPNAWRCPFYKGSRVCDQNAHQAGLAPYGLTQQGRAQSEYENYIRVFMPVGALPCCPTPPFCSAPKCADSFVTGPATAAPAVCTKHSAAENFAYMTGQSEWPAYFGYAGGNHFDVNKHWDVLGRILGCAQGSDCKSAETMDLVIDMGSNYAKVSEELAIRHFSKSFILIDAAPFSGPDFNERHGNESWRQTWYREQVPARPKQVVPEFEFHNFGVSNTPGTIDLCTRFGFNEARPCPIEKLSPDSIIPARLSADFQAKFAAAQSAYVKIDVEGSDILAVQGMTSLLQETRGAHPDGSPKHLINFMMLEYAPIQMGQAKILENLIGDYDLKNMTTYLEAEGFEVFLMGPRYLPLTHGSWDDRFRDWFQALGIGSTAPHCPMGTMYPNFRKVADCAGPWQPSLICDCNFATDLFAMRATHPKAAEIKVALGACTESRDFYNDDSQYDKSPGALFSLG